MIRRPPRSTRTDTLLPYTTLFRSPFYLAGAQCSGQFFVPASNPWTGKAHASRRAFGAPRHEAFLLINIVGLMPRRSEEHTSELQSLMRISYAVFCLKKKKKQTKIKISTDPYNHQSKNTMHKK